MTATPALAPPPEAPPTAPQPRATGALAVCASVLVVISAAATDLLLLGIRSLPLQQAGLFELAAAVVYLVWLTAVRHNTELRSPDTVMSAVYVVGEYFLPVINLWAPAKTLLTLGRTGTVRPVPRALVIAWAAAWDIRVLGVFSGFGRFTPWVTLFAGPVAAVLCVLVIAATQRAQRQATIPQTVTA